MSIEKGKIINIRSTFSNDEKVVIAGFNDSQGLNANTTPWKEGILDYLSSTLFPDRDDTIVINGFSLTLNKTEHLDQILKHNPTIADIKMARRYAAVSAMKKVMQDIHLPQVFGNVGKIYGLTDKVKPGDENVHVSDAIKEAEKPIIIYSSGSNDVMRIAGSNPFAIKGQYKARDKKINYNYALEMIRDEQTMKRVINSIKRNFETIYGINQNSEVFTLGTPIPKVFTKEEFKVFRDFVIAYNDELQTLCKEYGTSYIDTIQVGKDYNNSNVNFHYSAGSQVALSDLIIDKMHENRFNGEVVTRPVIPDTIIDNRSVDGIIDDLDEEYQDLTIKWFRSLDDTLESRKHPEISIEERKMIEYVQKRVFDVREEKRREREIWQNVKKKNYNM